MELVDRCAISVRPAQPMVDWVRAVDIELGGEPVAEHHIREYANIYLIPSLDHPDDAERYLKRRAREIFEAELGAWFMDEDLWPKQRGWKTFSKWMSWEVQEMVYDLEKSSIRKEDTNQPVEFDFHEPLRDSDGWVDRELAGDWVVRFGDRFFLSPELQGYENAYPDRPGGWSANIFDFLHVYEGMTIGEVDKATLSRAFFSHFPRKVFDPDFDAEAVVAEFLALFRFIDREFELEHPDQVFDFFADPQLVDKFDAAMNDDSNYGMAKSFLATGGPPNLGSGGLSNGLRLVSQLEEREPYRSDEPDVGRNDPCPCGSGKKYKKCCLKR